MQGRLNKEKTTPVFLFSGTIRTHLNTLLQRTELKRC